ncbi:MAG: hypothetical protein P0Y55_09910 [Candidatus Cohnella colombiensis]|uniref:Uncharacterized protein n=1 Tax=Candidatus Cohnella colombiensis TaxID=3121368 RepID=A0AA95ETE4_9BACL|nr:MAG: hypothetical protein P0Y55_09910 [Cohnella sp.]
MSNITKGVITINIQTDNYKIAPLVDHKDIVKLIEETESAIAQITGNPVTLIAYERKPLQ